LSIVDVFLMEYKSLWLYHSYLPYILRYEENKKHVE
jgi:hypothetical protein